MNEVGAIKDKRKIERVKSILKKTNLRDYLLFTMGINVGLRISDLLQLRFSDVLDEKGEVLEIIKVKEKKTKKTKVFYINDAVKRALKDYMSASKYGTDFYLFASRKGANKPISRVQAYRIVNEACRLAKIEGSIGTHTLRKTMGYWAYKQGIDITLLMRIFNHSAPSITLRYIGIEQEDINNVYINLNL